MFRCIANVKREVTVGFLATAIIVLGAGCLAQPGSFTTKAHRMDQCGKSGWVDSQLREAEWFEEQGNRSIAEMIRGNLYSVELMKMGCE